jgi:hypothetical protein
MRSCRGVSPKTRGLCTECNLCDTWDLCVSPVGQSNRKDTHMPAREPPVHPS